MGFVPLLVLRDKTLYCLQIRIDFFPDFLDLLQKLFHAFHGVVIYFDWNQDILCCCQSINDGYVDIRSIVYYTEVVTVGYLLQGFL